MTYQAGDKPSETSDPLGRWADHMQYPLRDFFDRLNAHLPRAVAEALTARLGVHYLEQLLTELDLPEDRQV
jgi:hypothetical protein